MRIYEKNGKHVLHSTQIYNYLICPAMMKLSEQHRLESNKAMEDGLILERMVFGNHDGELAKYLEGKRKATIDEYKRKAEKIKPYFVGGEPFKNIEIELENVILLGEVDYFTPEVFYDLKTTKTHKYWNSRTKKEELLQAVYYPYIQFLLTGTIPDFHYKVFAFDNELVNTYIVPKEEIEKKFSWIEGVIDGIVNDPFFSAYPSDELCLQQTFGACNYLNICAEAQEFFKNTEKIIELL